MKAARFLAIMVLAFCFIAIVAIATGHGQTLSCETQVSINADLSGSLDIAGLVSAGARLQEQGADPRFLIAKIAPWPTLETLVDSMRKQCSSWQSPNGGVKANMLVFAVAPKERKMAIFYGPGYNAALSGQVDRIKRDFMAPRFKGGDWVGGLEAGANQVAERIKASVDESNKPVTYTTTNNNQATDFHGLWIFLWILGGLAFGGAVLLIYYMVKKAKEQTETAQQNAIASRSRAVDLLAELNEEVKKYSDIAVAPLGVKMAIPIIDTASQQLSVLAASLSGDPTTQSMSQSFYESLDESYSRIESKLNLAKQYLVNKDVQTPKTTRKSWRKPESTRIYTRVSETPAPPPAPAPAPAPVKETVVVHDNSNDFLTGMLVNEALHSSEHERYRDPEPEPEPERHSSHRHDDDSSSSSSSSDWGGSSSSFDSGSSWSDSSSSSSFDSGSSSDSGGGFGGDSSSF